MSLALWKSPCFSACAGYRFLMPLGISVSPAGAARLGRGNPRSARKCLPCPHPAGPALRDFWQSLIQQLVFSLFWSAMMSCKALWWYHLLCTPYFWAPQSRDRPLTALWTGSTLCRIILHTTIPNSSYAVLPTNSNNLTRRGYESRAITLSIDTARKIARYV